MAGKVYTKSKLQGLTAVASALFTDLKAIGLTQVLPASSTPFTPTAGSGKFVFDSHAAINPMNATQPWRLLVDVTSTTANPGTGTLKIAVANPQQIPADGSTTLFPGNAVGQQNGDRVMGQLGAAWSRQTGQALGDVFITRNLANLTYDAGTTYSYFMVATDRGLALQVWEDASDVSPSNSWFLIQSPVDKGTGVSLKTDNSPIFCVYSCDSQEAQKFVVSESDVFRPTKSVSAEEDTINSAGILNGKDQVAIAKGNKYLITFPNRLNTDRYAYTEELDMIAYTSADVIAEESEIPVTVYSEGTPRIYRALKANGANNTKMRLLFLVTGGGVPVGP